MKQNNHEKHYTPKELPVNADEMIRFFDNMQRTDHYLEGLATSKDELEQHREKPHSFRRHLGNLALSHTARELSKAKTHEAQYFNHEYLDLIDAIPNYMTDVYDKALYNATKAPKAAAIELSPEEKKMAATLNYAIKEIIDINQSISPTDLNSILRRTIERVGFDEAEKAANLISRTNVRGMMHELAGTTLIYNLEGDFKIPEKRKDAEIKDDLAGIDAEITFDDGVKLTFDFKASEDNAASQQEKHDRYRRKNHITTPDNHIIFATGFDGRDFIPDRIGRVRDAANRRELARLQAIVDQRHQELLSYASSES